MKFQKPSFRKYYRIDFSFLAFMDLLEVKTRYIVDTYTLMCLQHIIDMDLGCSILSLYKKRNIFIITKLKNPILV